MESAGSGNMDVGRIVKTGKEGVEPRPEERGRGFSEEVVLGC